MVAAEPQATEEPLPIPDGWYVLYCERCAVDLAWTREDVDTYGDPDAWFGALKWATSQVEHAADHRSNTALHRQETAP